MAGLIKKYNSVELFAGCGGMAIGLERSGFNIVVLNEIEKKSCETLKKNKPEWNVVEGDIRKIDFTKYKDIDLLSGGFPCQPFSYSGNKLGLKDIRGTLFFQFVRAIKEIQPKIVLGENVKGLLVHDNGKTIQVIKSAIKKIGYTLLELKILNSVLYSVPQKRERLFFVFIKNDIIKNACFQWPDISDNIFTVKDALNSGSLYKTDCPKSKGQFYSKRKKEILSLIPEGGYWINLPEKLQREYMKKSYFSSGGRTGIARRLSWDKPCLTLTCSPAQKYTERCHPEETRPLTIREYARIQTFPDEWDFSGSITSQYKQIGNAVPVNLAYEIGKKLILLLNNI